MLHLIIISFFAGALTVLAPCILPLLPVIVGGSLTERHWYKPLIITGSLAISIVVFTLLLKFSTSLLGVPQQFWQIASGILIIILGIAMVWPKIWQKVGLKLSLKTNLLLSKTGQTKGVSKDILTGIALGPVFASCSPIYAFIVAGVLPTTFAVGMFYLISYALGLAVVLLLVATLGQVIINKLQWASKSNGLFKRIMGIIFIIVGIFIATGLDATAQSYLIQQGWYDGLANFEQLLMDK